MNSKITLLSLLALTIMCHLSTVSARHLNAVEKDTITSNKNLDRIYQLMLTPEAFAKGAPARVFGNGTSVPKGLATATGSVPQNGITYHGGPVMGNVNVYIIWYGTWTPLAKLIITDFLTNVDQTSWWAIEKSYTDGNGVPLSTGVTLAKQVDDAYSLGTSLTDNSIWSIVNSQLSSGALPVDANGFYLVLTAPDVKETSGFCTQFCGWHSYQWYQTAYLKFSFVGNAASQCPGSCSMQKAPNGDVGSDGAVSVVAHELAEAHSDPLLNCWYDSQGYENADKCAWTFGSTYTASNGQTANMKIGQRDYLVQQNWINAISPSGSAGYCGLSYNAAPSPPSPPPPPPSPPSPPPPPPSPPSPPPAPCKASGTLCTASSGCQCSTCCKGSCTGGGNTRKCK